MRLEVLTRWTLGLVFAASLGVPLGAATPTPAPTPSPVPAPAPAAPADTPRQALLKAELLFAQGHIFTDAERDALDDLRNDLVNSGDQDVAADLDLLRLGAEAQAQAQAVRDKSVATKSEEADQWADRNKEIQGTGFWRSVRDTGLTVFTVSTVATLLLAEVCDRNDALMQNGYFSDWSRRQNFVDGMHWALAGTAATMFFSLFPLLWGEARQ